MVAFQEIHLSASHDSPPMTDPMIPRTQFAT